MVKIYVGCALTHAPQEFRDMVALLKDTLRKDYEVLDFLGISAETPQHVYQHDIGVCVASCDVMLALCDHTSLGLGYEMAIAIEKLNKPVLAVAHRDVTVTRLIRGIPHPQFRFEQYATVNDIPVLLSNFVRAL